VEWKQIFQTYEVGDSVVSGRKSGVVGDSIVVDLSCNHMHIMSGLRQIIHINPNRRSSIPVTFDSLKLRLKSPLSKKVLSVALSPPSLLRSKVRYTKVGSVRRLKPPYRSQF
jgi:hypothetical protein